MARRLPRSFYRRDSVSVARALLGQRLVRVVRGRRLAGIIVETEAYLGICDKAAHTYNGKRTARNKSMWGNCGHAYVYFTYGMHHCVNVVAGRVNEPIAVLLRGLEPVEGIELMFRRRPRARQLEDLCSGPAKLAQALAIDRSLDGTDLTANGGLFIECERRRAYAGSRIGVSGRVGVGYAQEWADKPLRFFLKANGHVSRP